jgi:hypothetical protein
MDDYHFNNITKIKIKIESNHFGKNKNLQSYKNWTYFMYWKINKTSWMHFWIDIEFTKILGQFKQKKL